MSRTLCQRCSRPITGCICQFFLSLDHQVDNHIDVVILQHPQEVKQSKGSVPLLLNSLAHCQTIEGEDFSDNEQLNGLLNDTQRQVLLLYPSEQARPLEHHNQVEFSRVKKKKLTLLLIDATWKKAYRIYMLSKNLHELKHVTLPVTITGQYVIRSTNKKNALSSLEACIHALTLLESAPSKYQSIMDNFIKFNQFQLKFRPD